MTLHDAKVLRAQDPSQSHPAPYGSPHARQQRSRLRLSSASRAAWLPGKTHLSLENMTLSHIICFQFLIYF